MADLQCRDVRKAYGDRVVLDGVDLTVPEGTLTAILGSSGSGKTTLLRIVIGFLAPDGGAVSIGGTTVTDSAGIHVPPDKRAIGYVAQEGALFPHLTRRRERRLRAPARRAQARQPDRSRRSTSSASILATPSRGRTSSRAANSAASRSPVRSRRARRSSCSTSRSPGSTRHCEARREQPCSTRWPRRELPPYSSRTTRARRSRRGARSPSFAMARWSRRPRPRRSTARLPISTWPGLSATPWS